MPIPVPSPDFIQALTTVEKLVLDHVVPSLDVFLQIPQHFQHKRAQLLDARGKPGVERCGDFRRAGTRRG